MNIKDGLLDIKSPNSESQDKNSTDNLKDTVSLVSKNLSLRKGALFKRNLFLSIPGIIFFMVFSSVAQSHSLSTDSKMHLILILNYILPFVLIYTASLAHLFSIEKVIWVRSFFDRKDIDNRSSLRIAAKLFFPALRQRMMLFARYYIFLTLICSLFIPYFFHLMLREIAESFDMYSTYHTSYEQLAIFSTLLILLPMVTFVYFYYLKIKFRYFWFVFLDTYGDKKISFHELMDKVYKLNDVNKTKSFQESLKINLSADATENFAQFILAKASMYFRGNSNNSNVNSALTALQLIGSEYIHQLASLSIMVGNYVLYVKSKSFLGDNLKADSTYNLR